MTQIIGEKDADGFYWGECGNRSGYVPCNMVSEVQVDDERMVRDLLKDDNRNRGMRGTFKIERLQQHTYWMKLIETNIDTTPILYFRCWRSWRDGDEQSR